MKFGTRAVHLCIDYHKLNKATHADPFQMPLIQELLDNVAGATWLTKLDMNQGFYQVSLDKDSETRQLSVLRGENINSRECLLVL